MPDTCGRYRDCEHCGGRQTISKVGRVDDLMGQSIGEHCNYAELCPHCTNGYQCAGVDHYHKPADSLIPLCSTCHKEVQND